MERSNLIVLFVVLILVGIGTDLIGFNLELGFNLENFGNFMVAAIGVFAPFWNGGSRGNDTT